VLGGLPILGLLGHAHGATVFVDLDRVDALPARVAAALFDPARGLRLIFAAADETRARARLDHYRDQVTAIALTPLAARPDDIVPILAFHWATELDTAHPVEALGAAALDALVAHAWPNNLDELFDQAPRLLACLTHPTLRRAAEALGVTRQTLTQHLDRLGVAMVAAADRG
jgi:DNA-binding NtrC family response regulator